MPIWLVRSFLGFGMVKPDWNREGGEEFTRWRSWRHDLCENGSKVMFDSDEVSDVAQRPAKWDQ